ncbi:hypothetical protein NG831_06560 [Xanthomonas sacchari]|uniref:hypothetical protein n=1 Tax=Xanthomonas sacchari TaxID=56458 RepID=UPI002253AEBC|nr:hypothetical protein [Xanthomonas sacchari]MCW0413477.1 hypothetical protein [Xanthomonas sacchari]UYK67822.1 hypothetical protein NG831_06560 [Xanthomonas sacchari]
MGGESNKAQKEAQRAEALRQGNIASSVAAINSAYSNPQRSADINDFLGATRSFYTNELGRQKQVADRSLKFAMARNGLTGGSATIDANRTLGENYQQGVLNADRLAQSAANNLRTSDEQSRLNLIAMAQNGLDATTSANQAATALQNNLAAGQTGVKADALGDVFGGLASIYTKSKETAAERRGNRDIYNLLYTPGFGYGGK